MIQTSKAILFCAVLVTNCFKDEAARVILKPDTISGASSADSPCGDWTPFKQEKCVKLVDRVGFQNKEDGEIICRAFAKELHSQEIPKLVTIKTEEEQQFLQKLLFKDLGYFDNVWLGLEFGKNDAFRWNDGTDLRFTNWADGSMTGGDRKCVQMESGEGAYERGKWVRVNCKKRNAIVCERAQPWSVAVFQNIILNLKSEVAKNKEEAEQKLNESNQKVNEANQKINAVSQEIQSLKNNSVPIGFIYAQLPNQQPPTSLWPQTKWTDVSSSYAGLFFRVGGGNAAPFGQIQEGDSSRLQQVANIHPGEHSGSEMIPADGSWSGYIASGKWEHDYLRLRFRLSGAEVRPRNQAMKIWQRTE